MQKRTFGCDVPRYQMSHVYLQQVGQSSSTQISTTKPHFISSRLDHSKTTIYISCRVTEGSGFYSRYEEDNFLLVYVSHSQHKRPHTEEWFDNELEIIWNERSWPTLGTISGQAKLQPAIYWLQVAALPTEPTCPTRCSEHT